MSNWKPWEDPDFESEYSYVPWSDMWTYKLWIPPQKKYGEIKNTEISFIQTPKWTMCEDSLPSPHQDVLACDKAGAMTVGRVFRARCGSDSDFFVENEFETNFGIIAWMPLPAAPKGV